MFDIGWTELLVIAVVLIVVVGPKDLPPMIRAFGKMTSNFRKMAGDFRAQFDEALREADMDDVRKTLSDAQKLNPTNALRDAINPLRQMGQDIKSDLQKATQVSTSVDGNASELNPTDVAALKAVEGAEPVSAAPEVPVSVEPAAPKPAVAASAAVPAATAAPVVVDAKKAPSSAAPVETAAVPAKTRTPRKTAVKAAEPPVVAPAVVAKAPKPVRKAAKPAAAPEAVVAVTPDKPKRSRVAAKKTVEIAAAAPEAVVTEAPVSKPATRKRAVKKTDMPKDEA
jgi:sec-independent protein translocase protein TatB